jgi:hypothetical protein
LYYRSGEERTIGTRVYAIDVVHVDGPPERWVAIEVPEDDKAAFVPTWNDIRVNQLVRVVVIVPRPSTGW